MTKPTITSGRFILFDDPTPLIAAGSPAAELYALAERLREAAQRGEPSWARDPTVLDYAGVCFWTMRRQEYGFVADSFTSWERTQEQPLRVLDVGCGVVPLCNWLSARGHQVTAIDPAEDLVTLLREHNANDFYGSSVDYRCASSEALPFDDASFDAVTCVSVLEHIPTGNDCLALMEIARVLRPSGRLFITFDVGPPPDPIEDEPPWPAELRRIDHPFTGQHLRRLLEQLEEAFDLSTARFPERLDGLTWEDVHRFWRQTQQADGRGDAVRHYLAIGGALDRTERLVLVDARGAIDALLQGQKALRHAMEYQRSHAAERLRQLERVPKFGRQVLRLLRGGRDHPSLRTSVVQNARLAAHTLNRRYWYKTPYRRWLRKRIGPRLGLLEQYAPRPLHLPPGYSETAPPKEAPAISIATPAFNGAAFLERTIRSVVGQTYPAIQYAVQDGGSEDGTVDILRRYADRLHHHASEPDDGQAQAINRAFAHTDGPIMAYLNADDLLLPGTLSYVADYFIEHPDVDVVYGHRVLIDSEDREVGRWIMPPHSSEVLRWASYLPQETMFWRRSLWEKTGGKIDESFDFAMDWDLILRFMDAGAKFACLPRFLGAFRVHKDQKTHAIIEQVGHKEMNRLVLRVHGRQVSSREIRRHTRRYLMSHLGRHLAYRTGLVRY